MSKIEVNQISSQCGSTLTIGQSGDTVTLACGATQSGFGRTGTVDWDTTAKTASFTAVSGTGYFVNTTSAAITLTLPATPSAGDIVAFKDYAFTFATNNLTVDGNGSPIGGVDGTQGPIYSTNGTSKTFIYVDGTKGWLVTNESTDTSQESTPTYIVATGGTITCCGDYKIHTFTGPGTFTVCSVGNPLGSNTVDYLVIAGGGAGANKTAPNNTGETGAGGGAGGYRESSGAASGCYSISPLGACVSALPVTATGYPIIVGGGGTSSVICGSISSTRSGSNSSALGITSAGGGGGGARSFTTPIDLAQGSSGGSGGGGTYADPTSAGAPGGSGNVPPVSPPQGNAGGNGPGPGGAGAGAGGGGATAVGTGISTQGTGGTGGAGATSSINGTPTGRAGGGGGGGNCVAGAASDGGGVGGSRSSSSANNGVANTGGGGGGGDGGGCSPAPGGVGQGGSGIVIIRYKYQ